MICTPCGIAADLAEGRETLLRSGAHTQELPPEVVSPSHGDCLGDTWCDCQHR